MVPVALLISFYWNDLTYKKRIINGALIFPILALFLYIALTISGKKEFYMNSDKYLIENNAQENIPIYHWKNKSYSGQFYTKGAIKVIEDNPKLTEQLSLNNSFILLIPHKKLKDISSKNKSLLKEMDRNYKKGIYIFKK